MKVKNTIMKICLDSIVQVILESNNHHTIHRSLVSCGRVSRYINRWKKSEAIVRCTEHLKDYIYISETESPLIIKHLWKYNGEVHREGDKPASISEGVKLWYKHGQLWREGDKPTIFTGFEWFNIRQ